jgi:hypothetical protein
MTTLDALVVADRLQLGPEYRAWLDALEAIGPPPGGIDPPTGQAAARLLARLGVDEPDRAAVLDALPTRRDQPELWWLLERAFHAVLADIGRLDSDLQWPMLPPHVGATGRCFWVFVFLCAVPAIREWHRKHGVPDNIGWDTLADLGRNMGLYRRRTGCVGLDVAWWIALHFRGALFALGRLQFNPYRIGSGRAGPLFWYDGETTHAPGAGFRAGVPGPSLSPEVRPTATRANSGLPAELLGVHIPQAGPLSPSACDASFRAAARFFAERFPDRASGVATCTSWLMDDQLLEYLPAESNIVQFQRRFELVPGARDADDSIFRFVFGRVPTRLSDVVPRTTLERAILEHVARGRHWRMRTGWLRL